MALVGSTAAVPEKEPLKCLAAFQLVREAEFVVFIFFFEEIEELGGGFHNGKRGRLRVVNYDRNTTWTLKLVSDTDKWGENVYHWG